jgi:hypothetical protein
LSEAFKLTINVSEKNETLKVDYAMGACHMVA